MTMVFQRVETQGIAQLSYLIGDDSSGTAAVVDPRPNVDIYLEMARQYGMTITHVFETHIHADLRPELSVWAGQMLEHDKPILLVVEDETDLDWIVWRFVYTGFTKFAGYLVGGMKGWENAGLPLKQLPQVSVHELKERLSDVQLLDVRSPSEWENGHIPGARHFYVADMRDGIDGLDGFDKQKPLVTYCNSGYRADIAASLLEQHGYTDVRNVPASWQAWTKAGYDVEK